MNKNKSTVQYMYFLVFVSLIWDKTNLKKCYYESIAVGQVFY